MKKNRSSTPAHSALVSRVSPEEALRFLDDLRKLPSQIDEPTHAISLRVPENILRAIRLRAKAEGKKYQSLMIEYLRKGLSG